jgi:hypothetical protein
MKEEGTNGRERNQVGKKERKDTTEFREGSGKQIFHDALRTIRFHV